MAPRKLESTKGHSSYPIPEEALEVFRERKRDKGVLLYRSLVDALSFACRNRQVWW